MKKHQKINMNSGLLRKLAIPLVLLVLMVFFATQSPNFLTWYNIKNILIQNTYIMIAATGLTFAMISGGIDLSLGYQLSLNGVVLGLLMCELQLPVWLSIVLCIIFGTALGLFNGFLCVKLRVTPLIVTLATSTIFQGVSYMLSGASTIINFPKSFVFIGQGYIGPIPLCIIIAVVVIAVASFVLRKTYFGRYVYALGGNEEAARLSGINVNKMRVLIFGLCGFFVGLASVVMVARSGTASSTLGTGTEFTCLTAGIIGGISFNRSGEGSVGGMIIGVLLLAVLGNGMQLMMLGTYPQYIAKGAVLILAMTLDTYQRDHKKQSRLSQPA